MTICLFTETVNGPLVWICKIQFEKTFCMHIDIHMNAKWIPDKYPVCQTRTRNTESDLFVSFSLAPALFGIYPSVRVLVGLCEFIYKTLWIVHAAHETPNTKTTNFFFFCCCPSRFWLSHIHCAWYWVRWIKFALLSTFEYLKMRRKKPETHTRTQRKPESMIAVSNVCIAFVINRVGFSHHRRLGRYHPFTRKAGKKRREWAIRRE